MVQPVSYTHLGTEFRKSVWSILQTIPYGKTTTYGDIGKEIAKQQGKDRMLSLIHI